MADYRIQANDWVKHTRFMHFVKWIYYAHKDWRIYFYWTNNFNWVGINFNRKKTRKNNGQFFHIFHCTSTSEYFHGCIQGGI